MLWTRSPGHLIVDILRRVVQCGECPCTGTGGIEFIDFGCCTGTGTGTYIVPRGLPDVLPFAMANLAYYGLNLNISACPALFPENGTSGAQGQLGYHEGYLTWDPTITLDFVDGPFTHTSVTGVWYYEFPAFGPTGTDTSDAPTFRLYVYTLPETPGPSTTPCNIYAEIRMTDPDFPGEWKSVRSQNVVDESGVYEHAHGPSDCSCLRLNCNAASAKLDGTIPDEVAVRYCKGLTPPNPVTSPSAGYFPAEAIFIGYTCSCCEDLIFTDADYPDQLTVSATYVSGTHFAHLDAGPFQVTKSLQAVPNEILQGLLEYRIDHDGVSNTRVWCTWSSFGHVNRSRKASILHTDLSHVIDQTVGASVSGDGVGCNPIDWAMSSTIPAAVYDFTIVE